MSEKNRGFTLVELLVVIAIIGLLASVVFASLTVARRKSRDARRIADLKQIQVALELYFDANLFYPVGGYAALQPALSQGTTVFIPEVPQDPLGAGRTYRYCRLAASPTMFHLGASLEDGASNSLALLSDSDFDTTACLGGDTIDGTPDNDNVACSAGVVGECYDLRS